MKIRRLAIISLLFVIDKTLQFFCVSPTWFNNYADDFLFIPISLGYALAVQQYYVSEQFVFSLRQIIAAWLIFSVLFEGIYPQYSLQFTRDYWDILVYGLGAIFFKIYLNQGATN
jgi:hypothetical protein